MESPASQQGGRERSGLERLPPTPAVDVDGDEAAARSFRTQQPFRALGSRVERGGRDAEPPRPRRA